MEVSKLLPIGSVVTLEGGDKKTMIFGVKQVANNEETEYDYIGVLYPEGFLGGNYQFLFNHEDIQEVVFRGYEDDARKEFIEKLSEYYTESNK